MRATRATSGPWACWPIMPKSSRNTKARVEQFLRDELEYVVVETFDHARAGIAMLREEVGGRATFFVDSLRSLNLTVQPEPACHFRARPGAGVAARPPGRISRSAGAGGQTILAAPAVRVPGGRRRSGRAPGARKSRLQLSDARRNVLSGTRGHRRPSGGSRTAGDEARTARAGSGGTASGAGSGRERKPR